ncbi:MAG: helix-turn-helix transcriptional regulator [Eubacteriales bacterium]|nr:helix-turn-helix transcriptional regulator [Eubacteriales bacterium]
MSILHCYPRLLDVREDMGITQKTVAEVLGISVQQYSLYERGDREIPFHHAITLAKFYNISLDYIAGITNNKRSGI